MKIKLKYLLLLLTIGLISACSDDDDGVRNASSPLLGTWKLTEILSDPGDGSGTFSPVESERQLVFAADGGFSSNGNICEMSTTTEMTTAGTYSITDGVLIPDDCSPSDHAYLFELDGEALIIIYPCIEPCRAKYERP